ncbi:MAG: DUF4982 domain-containing protein [Bacteroidales bacterium]|nr:DUF4982 domain-containing protein [Bacteroidales bacterium]
MKKLILLSALLMASSAIGVNAQYVEKKDSKVARNYPLATFATSQKQLLNFGWRFQFGAADASAVIEPDYDDGQWRTLDLPHDFQFEQPWVEAAGGARGFKEMSEGWYRKTFEADTLWRGKQVLLDFGGIMYYGDVYLNGHKVASTEYGYVGFEADVTRQLRYDAPNVVAVYANTGKKNGSRWYTGGGLFRDVYLKVQNPTHIARHGIYVTTPQVSANEADVQVEVEVAGWQKHDDVTLQCRLFAPDGALAADLTAGMPDHTKASVVEVKIPLAKIQTPALWDIDAPQLYTAEVVLMADGMVADSQRVEFGIRSIEYGKDFGFKLNGRKVLLKGIANHHDLGALGVASFDKAIEREMRQLKSFGYNCIRSSHNPYSESFTRIADRVGLLIVDELIDKWSDNDYWGGRKPFMTLWPSLIKEWVKRDRNCPSVVLWSLGNELQTRSDWSGYDTNDWGVTTYRIFDQMLKRYDATRPTTVAMFPARAGAQRGTPDFNTYRVPPELAQVSEVSSFNYQSNCYNDYLKHAPWMILFQSEAQTEWLLNCLWNMPEERSVGLAYWGAIEYWGESNGWPKKGWNYSYFRHTLETYPQAYLIKSAFAADEPVVHIGVRDGKGETVDWNDVKVGKQQLSNNWTFAEGSRQSLYTFTNAAEVELIYNGKSIGRKKNNVADAAQRNMILWEDIDYGKGGTLTAVAYNGGREVARHTIQTAGKAVALRIEAEQLGPDGKPFTLPDFVADGMDLQYLTVRAVDSKGRTVAADSSLVSITVDGAATLYALDNGDHYTDELFTSDVTAKRLYDGTLQVVLRSKRGQAGKVTVRATADSKLKAASIKLLTK